MSFILYYPTKAGQTTTVTLPNPERSNTEARLLGQASGRSRGGDVYTYQKFIGRVDDEYSFTNLTAAQKAALDALVEDDLDGRSNTFEFDDHHGDSHTGRLIESDLAWVNTDEKTHPDTDPVYEVTLRIEKS